MVKLSEPSASVDFLGYTFRYDRDFKGRDKRYLNATPSKKSVQRAKDKLLELTGPQRCFVPIRVIVAQVNDHLRGWARTLARGIHAVRSTRSMASPVTDWSVA